MRLNKLLVAISFLLFFVFIGINDVNASVEKQRIYDKASLLSDDEVMELEEIAQNYSEKRETDFIIITVEEIERDLEKYLDDFYDNEGLGFDQEHGNVAILGIDMTRRDVVLLGFYKAEEYLDPNRLTQIRTKITPDLSAENYFTAFESFILLADEYMNYRPGVNPENPLYKTWVQLFIAIGIGALVVGIMAFHVNPKTTTTSATYRDDNKTKVLQRRDRYIRTTVTKRRKPQKSNSSGGGSGGGFGRTGGGHSRSSSRGKF